jgi:Ethanolamine utilization protein EutJ (predicted chaperonin)
MPSPGTRLGVDFGTSNTVAVVRWPDGRARPLLFEGSPLLPSSVYAEPSGGLVVGRDAVHSARLEPARFEPNPKRRIDDGTVLLGDRELAVRDVIAAVLRRVRDEWRRTIGDATAEVTLTCPAAWGATRRLVLADAATAAGLGRVRLVAEPVAAAAYFTQVLGRDVPIGSVVVVHDFGAGTFDASVIARTSTGFEVLAVDGRDDIGGVDIDNAIVKHLGTVCAERDPAAWQRLMQPSDVEARRARRLLFDDARVAKERLSRTPSAEITVPLLNLDVHLTRDELEDLARPLVEQTIRVTQGAMRWAQLAEGRMAGVFLVGGSSRIPLVATLLHRALGEAPVVIEQPELVVAEGSIVTGAAAVPVSAAPAPGPATGIMPKVNPAMYSAAGPPVRAVPGPPPGPPPFPVSVPPVSGMPASAPPISAPPVSVPPVSGAPASAPPGRAAGRVFVSSSQSSGQPAVSGPPVSPAAPIGPFAPGYARPAAPEPAWQAPHAYVAGRRSPAVRALLMFLLVLLLVATPIVTGYVGYYLASHTWPPPLGH